MTTVSLISESLRHRESIEALRERLSAAPLVAQYSEAIRLPALAAIAGRAAEPRRRETLAAQGGSKAA